VLVEDLDLVGKVLVRAELTLRLGEVSSREEQVLDLGQANTLWCTTDDERSSDHPR
jgi:hypothetical protein